MNEDEIIITEEDQYLEALESIPSEVRTFLWSDDFQLILKALGDIFHLNEEQREVVKSVTIKIVADDITPVAIRGALSEAQITEDVQKQLLKAIDDEIVSRTLLRLDLPEEPASIPSPTTETVSNAPSPLQALSMIKDRLAKPTLMTSTKRDYSNEIVAEPTTSEAPTGIKSIDPYRELPSE